MKILMEIFSFPVSIALLTYFFPIYLMKLRKEQPGPTYFTIYPLTRLNTSLSKYLGHNFYFSYLNDEYAEKSKKRVMIKGTLFTIAFVITAPFFLSSIWTIILSPRQFSTMFTLIVATMVYRFIK